MNIINEYNKLIKKIVDSFVKRFYKEIYEEDEYYYNIMNYVWINSWPVEVSDMYFSIDDIIISEAYWIPSKIFEDYYDLCLDTEWEPWINLYNFWRKNTLSKKVLEKEKKESLEKSKKNVEKAKKELKKAIDIKEIQS